MGLEHQGLGVATAPDPDVACDDGSVIATPLASVHEAIEVVLGWLATNGMGTWTLGNVALQELDPPSPGLLPIAVPASPRLLALRRDPADDAAIGPAVVDAA